VIRGLSSAARKSPRSRDGPGGFEPPTRPL
jgi:hypothetical protein